MKVALLADNLQGKLGFVSHAVSSKSQLPVLLNFLIEAKSGNLTISATDLEIGIQVNIPAKIDEEGSITTPAKTFVDLISNISSEKINLETDGTSLNLSGDNISANFSTAPSADFPKLFSEKGEKKTAISKDVLDKELSRVVFAASLDSTRPALSGVYFKPEKEAVTVVATDGYRLSLRKNLLKSEKEFGEALIVPSRVIRELLSVKDSEDISLFVSKNSNQVIFSQAESILVGRLIESVYPDYERIIPTDHSTKTSFDKNDAQAAVRQTMVFARESSNIIKLSVQKDKMVFSANAPSVGGDIVEIEAKMTGEENEIAFNARYLLDLFSALEDGQLTFEMTGPLNPGVFRVEGDKDFLHLIMPVRVQG